MKHVENMPQAERMANRKKSGRGMRSIPQNGKSLHLNIKYMGKLALLLSFILSVFPADANENRRHIHIVKRGHKNSHRGQTVAKIWIEKDGKKCIEIAWS